MYYCQSRYYVPELYRWLNIDNANFLKEDDINKLNLFVYCANNPVMGIDKDGHFGFMSLLAITIVSAVIGATSQLISNASEGKKGSELWRGVAGSAVGSAVNGLSLCLTMATGGASLFISAALGTAAQTGVDMLESSLRNEKLSAKDIIANSTSNFLSSVIGNYIGGKIIPTNRGWFQPRKFLSVFTKPYGQKILCQTAIGGVVSIVFNKIKSCIPQDTNTMNDNTNIILRAW